MQTMQQLAADIAEGTNTRSGEPVFMLETRAILYHKASVHYDGDKQVRNFEPICKEGDYGAAIAVNNIHDGERVIASVPATRGSYCVFAYTCQELSVDDVHEVCIGTVIAGDRNVSEDFDKRRWIMKGAEVAESLGWIY